VNSGLTEEHVKRILSPTGLHVAGDGVIARVLGCRMDIATPPLPPNSRRSSLEGAALVSEAGRFGMVAAGASGAFTAMGFKAVQFNLQICVRTMDIEL
jgi:hypothetical protein